MALQFAAVLATSVGMRFIGGVIEKLQRHPKRIVFPEGEEPRVLQAARQFHSLRLGAAVLLGDRTRIKAAAEQLGLSLQGIRILNPAESEDLDEFAGRLANLRRAEGLGMAQARETMRHPNYFGAMMVAMHQTDGLVTGASEALGAALPALLEIVKPAPHIATPSSCIVMEVEDTRFGEQGVMFLADCGVIPEPSVQQLADIAVSTAMLARQLLGVRPRVALLSYATKSRLTHPSIVKVQAATGLAKEKAHSKGLEADFEGELQVDAALIPHIAARKAPESKVAGRANVLIFPDLNAGNIASKLLQHAARANAYGQVLLGMDRPAAEVSRGSSAHDILGVAAIVGVQAVAYQKLYPEAGNKLPGE
jgi:phosphate acetyltransferase